jgi:predicted site-specific integrase-resolvase
MDAELLAITGKEIFSPEELCAFAGISYDTLQRYRRAGKGPPEVRIGTTVRYGPVTT